MRPTRQPNWSIQYRDALGMSDRRGMDSPPDTTNGHENDTQGGVDPGGIDSIESQERRSMVDPVPPTRTTTATAAAAITTTAAATHVENNNVTPEVSGGRIPEATGVTTDFPTGDGRRGGNPGNSVDIVFEEISAVDVYGMDYGVDDDDDDDEEDDANIRNAMWPMGNTNPLGTEDNVDNVERHSFSPMARGHPPLVDIGMPDDIPDMFWDDDVDDFVLIRDRTRELATTLDYVTGGNPVVPTNAVINANESSPVDGQNTIRDASGQPSPPGSRVHPMRQNLINETKDLVNALSIRMAEEAGMGSEGSDQRREGAFDEANGVGSDVKDKNDLIEETRRENIGIIAGGREGSPGSVDRVEEYYTTNTPPSVERSRLVGNSTVDFDDFSIGQDETMSNNVLDNESDTSQQGLSSDAPNTTGEHSINVAKETTTTTTTPDEVEIVGNSSSESDPITSRESSSFGSNAVHSASTVDALKRALEEIIPGQSDSRAANPKVSKTPHPSFHSEIGEDGTTSERSLYGLREQEMDVADAEFDFESVSPSCPQTVIASRERTEADADALLDRVINEEQDDCLQPNEYGFKIFGLSGDPATENADDNGNEKKKKKKTTKGLDVSLHNSQSAQSPKMSVLDEMNGVEEIAQADGHGEKDGNVTRRSAEEQKVVFGSEPTSVITDTLKNTGLCDTNEHCHNEKPDDGKESQQTKEGSVTAKQVDGRLNNTSTGKASDNDECDPSQKTKEPNVDITLNQPCSAIMSHVASGDNSMPELSYRAPTVDVLKETSRDLKSKPCGLAKAPVKNRLNPLPAHRNKTNQTSSPSSPVGQARAIGNASLPRSNSMPCRGQQKTGTIPASSNATKPGRPGTLRSLKTAGDATSNSSSYRAREPEISSAERRGNPDTTPVLEKIRTTKFRHISGATIPEALVNHGVTHPAMPSFADASSIDDNSISRCPARRCTPIDPDSQASHTENTNSMSSMGSKIQLESGDNHHHKHEHHDPHLHHPNHHHHRRHHRHNHRHAVHRAETHMKGLNVKTDSDTSCTTVTSMFSNPTAGMLRSENQCLSAAAAAAAAAGGAIQRRGPFLTTLSPESHWTSAAVDFQSPPSKLERSKYEPQALYCPKKHLKPTHASAEEYHKYKMDLRLSETLSKIRPSVDCHMDPRFVKRRQCPPSGQGYMAPKKARESCLLTMENVKFMEVLQYKKTSTFCAARNDQMRSCKPLINPTTKANVVEGRNNVKRNTTPFLTSTKGTYAAQNMKNNPVQAPRVNQRFRLRGPSFDKSINCSTKQPCKDNKVDRKRVIGIKVNKEDIAA